MRFNGTVPVNGPILDLPPSDDPRVWSIGGIICKGELMSSKSLHLFHFIHYKFHIIIKPGNWYSHVCYMSCSYHVPGYDNASNISL